MGRYLTCGIAEKIYIPKKTTGWFSKTFTGEEIISKLSAEINLDIYDITEDEENVLLTLKKNMVETYFFEFLEEQIQNTENDVRNRGLEELKKLKELKKISREEIIKLSKNGDLEQIGFWEGNQITSDISYVLQDHSLDIWCDMIYFVMEGKVFLECYYSILYYLRKAIISKNNNPIKDAFVISIIG